MLEKNIEYVSGETLTDEEKDLIDELGGNSLDDLSSYLNELYQDAHSAKSSKITEELDECLSQRNLEYDSETLSKINNSSGGSKTYHSLTAEQCRTLQDLLSDFLIKGNMVPFTISPTTIPEVTGEKKKSVDKKLGDRFISLFRSMGGLPDKEAIDNIKEMSPEYTRNKEKESAVKDAALVELEIRDKLDESNFLPEFKEFLSDLSTYPNSFLLGPLIVKKKKLTRKKVGVKYNVVEEFEECFEFKRVSPFDVFPEPNIKNIQDGYVFIRSEVSRGYVESLRENEGYNDEKIEMALDEYETLGSSEEEGDNTENSNKEDLQNKTLITDDKNKLWMTTFWGKLSGKHLKEFGLKNDKNGNALDKYKQYDVWCVRIGRYVVKVEFNPYPLCEIPLHTTSAYKEPGNFWHTGLPKVIRSYQKIINTAVRALQNNTAFSSAPIFDLNLSSLAKGTDITTIKPMMTIQSSHNTANMNNRPALTPIHTNMNVESLIYEIDKVSSYAGDASGISKYMSGGQAQGSGAINRTASGMNMSMQASSIKLKQIVANIDMDIIETKIKMLYNLLLVRYNKFENIGDINIIAGGTSSVATKDQDSARMVELLRNLSTPIMAPIVGESGFRKIINKITQSLGFGATQDIIPTDAEYELQKKIKEFQMHQQMMVEQARQSQGQQPPNGKNLQPDGTEKGKSI